MNSSTMHMADQVKNLGFLLYSSLSSFSTPSQPASSASAMALTSFSSPIFTASVLVKALIDQKFTHSHSQVKPKNSDFQASAHHGTLGTCIFYPPPVMLSGARAQGAPSLVLGPDAGRSRRLLNAPHTGCLLRRAWK